LQTLGLLAPLRRALDGTRPFLGICLGYQLLFTSSEEFGEGHGLDVIPGVVRRFPTGRKVPHMGWNSVEHGGRLRLFEGVPDGARVLGDRRRHAEAREGLLDRAEVAPPVIHDRNHRLASPSAAPRTPTIAIT